MSKTLKHLMHCEPVQNAIDSINMTTGFFFLIHQDFKMKGDAVNTCPVFGHSPSTCGITTVSVK